MRWPPLEERFWSKVEKTDSCWLWRGATRKFGYGRMKSNGHILVTHRISWEIHNGPIPKGLCVLHRCDNPACVNPAHLFLGTKSENNLDRDSKNRQAKDGRSGVRLHPECLLRGILNPMSKLTPSDVAEIRQRYASGETQTSIAKDFPVCQAHISKIVRKVWWH